MAYTIDLARIVPRDQAMEQEMLTLYIFPIRENAVINADCHGCPL